MSEPTREQKEAASQYLETLFTKTAEFLESQAPTQQTDEAYETLEAADDLKRRAAAIRDGTEKIDLRLMRPGGDV